MRIDSIGNIWSYEIDDVGTTLRVYFTRLDGEKFMIMELSNQNLPDVADYIIEWTIYNFTGCCYSHKHFPGARKRVKRLLSIADSHFFITDIFPWLQACLVGCIEELPCKIELSE